MAIKLSNNPSNGYIYGAKEDTSFTSILWVKGNHVINGDWYLTINDDGTATHDYIPGYKPIIHKLMDAPAGYDYQNVLHEAARLLKEEQNKEV